MAADKTTETLGTKAAQLRVTQVRSLIGAKPKVRASVRSLGLKRIHHSVLVEDTPSTRGCLHAARHLLAAEPVADERGGHGNDATTSRK